MSIDQAFSNLARRLHVLQDALGALSVTLDEDTPQTGELALSSLLSDAVLTARGFLEESVQQAASGHRAIQSARDLDRARRALVAAQENFHSFSDSFDTDVASYERVGDLHTLERERGRDWSAWAQAVMQALNQCKRLREEARNALFCCWRALAESSASASVLVRTTNIAQLFSRDASIVEPGEQGEFT